MALILSIESSGSVCSVAIHKEGKLMDVRESTEPNIHGVKLAAFIHEIVTGCKLSVSDLNAIAVSEGPGSYTGLRIGVSVAKGICYAAGLPLISVETLKSIAYAMRSERNDLPSESILLPMIDARRMEVYLGGFDLNLNQVVATQPVILEPIFYDSLKKDIPYFVAGNGSEKLDTGGVKGISRISGIELSALHIGPLAWSKFQNRDFADLAYFEPVYLKEFAVVLKKI